MQIKLPGFENLKHGNPVGAVPGTSGPAHPGSELGDVCTLVSKGAQNGRLGYKTASSAVTGNGESTHTGRSRLMFPPSSFATLREVRENSLQGVYKQEISSKQGMERRGGAGVNGREALLVLLQSNKGAQHRESLI